MSYDSWNRDVLKYIEKIEKEKTMKRYKCITKTSAYFSSWGDMKEDPDGEYVKWEDVIKKEDSYLDNIRKITENAKLNKKKEQIKEIEKEIYSLAEKGHSIAYFTNPFLEESLDFFREKGFVVTIHYGVLYMHTTISWAKEEK